MKCEIENNLDELADECPSDADWHDLVKKSITKVKALHEHSKKQSKKYPDSLVNHKLDIPFDMQVVVSSRYSRESSRAGFWNYEIYGTPSGVKCIDLINSGPQSERDLKALKRLIFGLFGQKPISEKEQFERDREFVGHLNTPDWIKERYENQYGYKPDVFVSHLRDIPEDIQIFTIAINGYSRKPHETSYWDKFQDAQIFEGLTRRDLMKTKEGCNVVRNRLLRFVNSAWY